MRYVSSTTSVTHLKEDLGRGSGTGRTVTGECDSLTQRGTLNQRRKEIKSLHSVESDNFDKSTLVTSGVPTGPGLLVKQVFVTTKN